MTDENIHITKLKPTQPADKPPILGVTTITSYAPLPKTSVLTPKNCSYKTYACTYLQQQTHLPKRVPDVSLLCCTIKYPPQWISPNIKPNIKITFPRSKRNVYPTWFHPI